MSLCQRELDAEVKVEIVINVYLPDPGICVPFGMMRYKFFDINLMSITIICIFVFRL